MDHDSTCSTMKQEKLVLQAGDITCNFSGAPLVSVRGRPTKQCLHSLSACHWLCMWQPRAPDARQEQRACLTAGL